MGAAQGEDIEKPVHTVCLDSFMIGQFEVTQKQWQEFFGVNPSIFKGLDRPVENVSWNDAQEFIKLLNRKSKKKYRLPTEAEWEYAARGGKKSKKYWFAGSNNVKDVAWFKDNSGGATIPVGKKKANELGIYDMSGNVREWCQDFFENNYYRWSPEQNPKGPSDGKIRVIRGGSWSGKSVKMRISNREANYASSRFPQIGFRLALPAD